MRRAQDALAAEAVDVIEQSFKDDAFAPAARYRERGSSGSGVIFYGVFVLCVILAWIYWLDIILL